MMIRIFLFGFTLSLFLIAISPSRTLVDQYGRPVDIHGRPIDRYGNATVYKNQPQLPIYDPYNLGGPPKGSYPNQNMYGKQYTSGAPGNPQGQGYM